MNDDAIRTRVELVDPALRAFAGVAHGRRPPFTGTEWLLQQRDRKYERCDQVSQACADPSGFAAELGNAPGGFAADIGAGHYKNFRPVDGAHHLAAARVYTRA